MTSATIADQYKRIILPYAEETGDPKKVLTQCTDFSLRGMTGPEPAYRSAGGHLLSFKTSATVQARPYLMNRYDAPNNVMMATPSTEHSVMCSLGQDEVAAFTHLITHPKFYNGILSIVSDSWDFWNVVDNVLPQVKDLIMNRPGKIVIRPDSGDPVKIICGDPEGKTETERKGLIQRLYEIFGGKVNTKGKGYIELPPYIGAVYGDSITPERARQICEHLKQMGFATTNVNFGIGSYTYQYVTRDTFGFAMKQTAGIYNGVFREIFKDPKTDDGNFKKSQKGMVAVVKRDGDLKLVDGLTPNTEKQVQGNLLETVWENGEFKREHTFDEIRERVAKESQRVYGGGLSL